MNILEKMKQPEAFSSSEQNIIDYMLSNPGFISSSSVRDLAKNTYTSPATVIRLYKKLDCESFTEFKVKFCTAAQNLAEDRYVDPNVPFQKSDSISEVAESLCALAINSLSESLSLFQENRIRRAVRKLYEATIIEVYALDPNLYYAELFQMDMLMRLNKTVNVYDACTYMKRSSRNPNAAHRVALLLSYTGETKEVIECCRNLRENRVYTISITSNDTNSLSGISNVTLLIPTLENNFTKIGLFSSKYAFLYMLDILYSGVYQIDYEHHRSSLERTDPNK